MKSDWNKMVVCCVFILTSAGVFAQDMTTLPPGFVFTNQAPDFSAWTIKCVYPDSEAKHQEKQAAYTVAMQKMAEGNPAMAKILAKNPSLGAMKPQVEKIQVTKTGKIRREEIYYFGGKTEERWGIPGAYLKRDAFSGRVLYESGIEGGGGLDFPEMAWVGAENFRGIEKVSGREVFVFASEQPRLALENPRAFEAFRGTDDQGSVVAVKALIDRKTQMPISLEWEGQVRTYTFGPAPTSPQTLPPDLAAIVEKSAKRAAAATRPLSPP